MMAALQAAPPLPPSGDYADLPNMELVCPARVALSASRYRAYNWSSSPTPRGLLRLPNTSKCGPLQLVFARPDARA